MELNTDSGHVTVIIDVSFTESPEIVTAFIRDEQTPFIVNQGAISSRDLSGTLTKTVRLER